MVFVAARPEAEPKKGWFKREPENWFVGAEPEEGKELDETFSYVSEKGWFGGKAPEEVEAANLAVWFSIAAYKRELDRAIAAFKAAKDEESSLQRADSYRKQDNH